MDSMRSLNTSLPRSTSKQLDPPEPLLSAFKAAALSVTNLYKSAAVDQGRARAEGYQDALSELLSYLDKENIGLSDGEGWRIRSWATERLDGRDSGSQNMESDDELSEKPDRGSSPVLQRSQSATRISSTLNTHRTASPVRTEFAPPPTLDTPPVDSTTTPVPSPAIFTFRSSHPYPQDADIVLSDAESPDEVRGGQDGLHAINIGSGTSHSRTPRSRHNNHSARITTRSSNSINRTAGQKRKINLGEFFDIGNLGHGKDGFSGGGKRGRYA